MQKNFLRTLVVAVSAFVSMSLAGCGREAPTEAEISQEPFVAEDGTEITKAQAEAQMEQLEAEAGEVPGAGY